MSRDIDVTPKQRNLILSLLKTYLPNTTVWAYGSRARWSARPQSDLDLVAFATPEQESQVDALKEAFEESDLPFKVDLFVWDAVPEVFKANIEKERVVLVTPAAKDGTSKACWAFVSVDEIKAPKPHSVAIGPFGSKMKSDCYVIDGVPVIRGLNIAPTKGFDKEFVFITEDKADELHTSNVFEGDLVFPHRGAIGEVGIALGSNEERYVLSSSLMKLTCDEKKADSSFVFYYFRSREGRQEILRFASTVGTPGIGQPLTSLKSMRLPLPPLKTQRSIAHVLGTLDDKIDLNRRMNETLEAMARALFKSWFVDFDPVKAKMAGKQPQGMDVTTAALFPDTLVESGLGMIPEGWRVSSLADVVNVNPREKLTKGTEAFYIDMKALPTDSSRTAIPWLRKFTSGTKFRNGDTLLARITPCLENGKTALVDALPDDSVGWGSTEFVVMRAKPHVPKEFPYLLARSVHFRTHAIQSMTGSSGRQRVPPKAVKDYMLAVPSRSILRAFGGLVAKWFEQVSVIGSQSETLGSLRDSLLPKLISGELSTADIEKQLKDSLP